MGARLPLLPRPRVPISVPREGASEHNHLGRWRESRFRRSHTHMLVLGLLFTSGVVLKQQLLCEPQFPHL